MIGQPRDDNAIAWRPAEEVIARAQLTRFISFCDLAAFDALYQLSGANIEWFTERVLSFLDIRFDKPYEQIVDLSRGVQWPRWCVGRWL